MNTLLVVGFLIALAAIVWFTFFFIWPAVATARFQIRVSELRDNVDDDLIHGRLPDAPDVRLFIDKADAMVQRPDRVSFSQLLAIHWTFQSFGLRLASPQVTYAGLTRDQRGLMKAYEDRMVEAIWLHVVFGSRLSIFFWLATKTVENSTRVRKLVPTPSVGELATEYTRTRNIGTLAAAA